MKNLKLLHYNIKRVLKEDPASHSYLEVLLLYPHIKALICYRIAHFFYRYHCFFIARFISNIGRFFTMIEIHPGATIGKGLFIDHGASVVIGATAIIKDDVTMFHEVTLGGTGNATGKKRHPTIENNVLIGTGAKILGDITIGEYAKIGASSVVLNDVNPYATVIGVKAKELKSNLTNRTL